MELDNKMSEIFDKYGAFFAFSNKQFDEKADKSKKYTSCGAGLICPVNNKQLMQAELDIAIKKHEEKDMAENGKKKIIWRELANYECQISYDISDAVAALGSYGITKDEIQSEWPAYMQHCIDNDYF